MLIKLTTFCRVLLPFRGNRPLLLLLLLLMTIQAAEDVLSTRKKITCSIIGKHLPNDLSVLRRLVRHVIPIRFDKFFGSILINKLPLTDMLVGRVGGPDLILEPSLLAHVVRKVAAGVQARVEPALGRDVGELAVFCCATSTIPTQRHRGVLERTPRVLAVGEELALLFTLVRKLGRGGGMTADTFPVLAGSSKATDVAGVDRRAWGSGWRLMCKFALLVGAV